MFHDILSLVRKKTVVKEENETYSILTCRCCGSKEEFLGNVDFNTLSNGWSALTLSSQSNVRVFQWLLCPKCTKNVRLTAGL